MRTEISKLSTDSPESLPKPLDKLSAAKATEHIVVFPVFDEPYRTDVISAVLDQLEKADFKPRSNVSFEVVRDNALKNHSGARWLETDYAFGDDQTGSAVGTDYDGNSLHVCLWGAPASDVADAIFQRVHEADKALRHSQS